MRRKKICSLALAGSVLISAYFFAIAVLQHSDSGTDRAAVNRPTGTALMPSRRGTADAPPAAAPPETATTSRNPVPHRSAIDLSSLAPHPRQNAADRNATATATATVGIRPPSANPETARADAKGLAPIAANTIVGGSADTMPSNRFPEPWICFAPEAKALGLASRHGPPAAPATPQGSGPRAAAFQLRSAWNLTATNGFVATRESITLTWSIVPDDTQVWSGSRFDAGPSSLETFLGGVMGARSVWLARIQQVFDSWGAIGGVRFVYEPNDDGASLPTSPGQLGVRGDIRLSARPFDPELRTIAVNYYPSSGGDMVMNTNSDYIDDPSQNWRAFRNTVAHEIGHGLGLAHVCPDNDTKLMEPYVSKNFDGPQFDEIYSLQRQYGDRLEDPDAIGKRNDSTASATRLGLRDIGTQTHKSLSLDSGVDADFFRFTTPANLYQISVALRPVGHVYYEGPQGEGDCELGAIFNARKVQNLGFSILDSSGMAIVTRQETATGFDENLYNFVLPSTGPFYIHVFGSNGSDLQLYDLEFTISAADLPILTVNQPTILEGRPALFFLELSKASPVETSIDYHFEHRETASADFEQIAPGRFVFPPYTLAKTIVVPTFDDDLNEALETFQLVLGNPTGIAGSSGATATITDNDPEPEFSITPASASEGSGAARVEATLSAVSGRDVRAQYFTYADSAESGTDFIVKGGTLLIAAGQTSASVEIPLVDDAVAELPERFRIDILSIFAAATTNGSTLVTIIDDDTAALLSGPGSVRVSGETGGAIQIGWRALSGLYYSIEYSDDCRIWIALPGAESILATGDSPTFTTTATAATRFYRVVELPSP